MTITTRDARTEDIPACARVLAEAFRDDPLMAAIWPKARPRHAALPAYFTASLRHFHMAAGGIQVAADADGRIGAAAVWDAPGTWSIGAGRILRAVPELLAPMGTRAPAAIRVLRALDAHHPHDPEHWYLANLGAADEFRGQGFAARLMASRLSQCDREQLGAYLVATRTENVQYYEKFGFTTTKSFALPGNQATMWAMWRPPATAT